MTQTIQEEPKTYAENLCESAKNLIDKLTTINKELLEEKWQLEKKVDNLTDQLIWEEADRKETKKDVFMRELTVEELEKENQQLKERIEMFKEEISDFEDDLRDLRIRVTEEEL